MTNITISRTSTKKIIGQDKVKYDHISQKTQSYAYQYITTLQAKHLVWQDEQGTNYHYEGYTLDQAEKILIEFAGILTNSRQGSRKFYDIEIAECANRFVIQFCAQGYGDYLSRDFDVVLDENDSIKTIFDYEQNEFVYDAKQPAEDLEELFPTSFST